MANKKTIKILGLIFVSAALIAGVLMYSYSKRSFFDRSYSSPSGGYVIEVYRYHKFFSMPGDSSSGAGYVVLKNKEGDELARKSCPMINTIEFVDWEDDHVSIKAFVDWSLDVNS